MALGAAAKGDGGGGFFAWYGGAVSPSLNDEGITFVCTLTTDGGSTVVGYWKRVFSGPINVRWFASLVSGTDWSPAIQRAVDAAKPVQEGPYNQYRSGHVYIPQGVYTVKKAVVIDGGGSSLYLGQEISGDGPLKTVLHFYPENVTDQASLGLAAQDGNDAYASCFRFVGQTINSRLFGSALRNLSINLLSSDGAAKKRGVVLLNTDRFLMENVSFAGPWGQSVDSRGVWILSGQVITLRDIHFAAGSAVQNNDFGTPIYLSTASGSPDGGAVDHLHIHDCYFRPGNQSYAIEVDPGITQGNNVVGTIVSNLVFQDANISGGHGILKWIQGTQQSVNCTNFAFRNLRFEGSDVLNPDGGPPNLTGIYGVHIERTNTGYTLTNFTFDNVAFAGTRLGARLDLCDCVSFRNCVFGQPVGKAILAVDRAYSVELDNCFSSSPDVVFGDRYLERVDAAGGGAGFPRSARIVAPSTVPIPGRGVTTVKFAELLDGPSASATCTPYLASVSDTNAFKIPVLAHGWQRTAKITITAQVGSASVEWGEFALSRVGTTSNNFIVRTSAATSGTGTPKLLGTSAVNASYATDRLTCDAIVVDVASYNAIWVRNNIRGQQVYLMIEVTFSSTTLGA